MLQGSAIRRQPIPHESVICRIGLQQDDWLQFKPEPRPEAIQTQVLPDYVIGAIRCQFENLQRRDARYPPHFDLGFREHRQDRKFAT